MKKLVLSVLMYISSLAICDEIIPYELQAFYKIYKTEYEGHYYIVFRNERNRSIYNESIVHDPNCPCHKVNNE